jgi:cyclic dehypoxanthinyl futalosine synthase
MMMTQEQALDRLNGNDLLQLGMDAGDVRQSLWPEPVVTYTVGYRVSAGNGAQLEEVSAAIERGATGLVFSALPGASLAAVTTDVAAIHQRFPELVLTGFSPAQIARLGDTIEAFTALQHAGLSLFGSATDDSHPANRMDWVSIHRAAHQAGLKSVAVLELRSSDTSADWVTLLEDIDSLQRETNGFLACEPRIEKMERALDEVTGAQYLKMVALCRLYLDTIPHLQVDWSVFGPKVLQVALRFGADDAGLVLASERDRKIPSHHSGEEELRRIIRDAGFQPSQRDAIYGRQFVY